MKKNLLALMAVLAMTSTFVFVAGDDFESEGDGMGEVGMGSDVQAFQEDGDSWEGSETMDLGEDAGMGDLGAATEELPEDAS